VTTLENARNRSDGKLFCDMTRTFFVGCSGNPVPSENSLGFRRVSDSKGEPGLGSDRFEPFASQRDITALGHCNFQFYGDAAGQSF
jgi:hypothetical protein